MQEGKKGLFCGASYLPVAGAWVCHNKKGQACVVTVGEQRERRGCRKGILAGQKAGITEVIPVFFLENWLQVLGTTETPQIDQGVRHQFHPVVALLDVLEPEQQPLK
jgi:hypothetical protein